MLSVIAIATYISLSGSKLAGDSRRFTASALPEHVALALGLFLDLLNDGSRVLA